MSSNGEILNSETFTIVAIGKFNPAIFQPHWLAKNNLIRDEEADAANVRLITNEVTIVKAPWFSLQVTGDRFVLESLDPVQNFASRDLVVGIFKILEHTPMSAIGLNAIKQFQLEDLSTWHQFGDYYAPKTTWDLIMDGAGMLNLAIVGNVRYADDELVPVRIVLEPSKQAPQFGVQISINHHFQRPESSQGIENYAVQLMEVVSRRFDEFFQHVETTLKQIFSEYTNAKKRE